MMMMMMITKKNMKKTNEKKIKYFIKFFALITKIEELKTHLSNQILKTRNTATLISYSKNMRDQKRKKNPKTIKTQKYNRQTNGYTKKFYKIIKKKFLKNYYKTIPQNQFCRFRLWLFSPA